MNASPGLTDMCPMVVRGSMQDFNPSFRLLGSSVGCRVRVPIQGLAAWGLALNDVVVFVLGFHSVVPSLFLTFETRIPLKRGRSSGVI